MPGENDPNLAAGELDKLVTLLAPVLNTYEDEIPAWNPVGQAWASVGPNFAQEMTEAGRTIEIVTVPILIRYRADIDARWRIQDGAHLYEIEGIADIARRQASLRLNCKEVL